MYDQPEEQIVYKSDPSEVVYESESSKIRELQKLLYLSTHLAETLSKMASLLKNVSDNKEEEE